MALMIAVARLFLVADSGYNPYTTVLVTTREHLEQNPEEVKRVVAAVRAGWWSRAIWAGRTTSS